MQVTAVRRSLNADKNQNENTPPSPSFRGPNPVIWAAEGIAAGGFPAEFILQDGLGFILPRLGAGAIRGRKDENGNLRIDPRTGEPVGYNWELVRKETVRELLSGPSAFIIPLGLIYGVKKFGRGNNVKMDYLHAFEDSAAKSVKGRAFEKELFYKNFFTNMLESTLPKGTDIQDYVKTFVDKQTYADNLCEQAKNESLFSKKGKEAREAAKKARAELAGEFEKIAKSTLKATDDFTTAKVTGAKNPISVAKLSEYLADYADDAGKNLKKMLSDGASDAPEAIRNFTKHRLGTRFMTNMGMWLTVVAFYTIIPKLYNWGLKDNPALKGTAAECKAHHHHHKHHHKDNDNKKKDVSFEGKGGVIAGLGNGIMGSSFFKGFSNIFEFDGAFMSRSAMIALLYGFCIPSRLYHAQDKYDRAEIAIRDLLAFTALLCVSPVLKKLYSDIMTKTTGLVLDVKSQVHKSSNKFQQFLHYINPVDSAGNIKVLDGGELTSRYSNVKGYKNGLMGMCEFIKENKGHIGKVLSIDDDVAKHAKTILDGKDLKKLSNEKIIEEFTKAKDNDAYKAIVKILERADNKIVSKAKTRSYSFGLVAAFIVVPALIIEITRICEKHTRKRTAKDFAQAA